MASLKWGEERGVESRDVITEINKVKEDKNFGERQKIKLREK